MRKLAMAGVSLLVASVAVRQANASKAIPGWKLELVVEDDEAKPDVGKNVATKLAGDDDVVAVVGPANSSVAHAVQPTMQSAGIPVVSPANTDPTLTKGADVRNPKRVYDNYFRTCTTDNVQGPFAAKYLKEKGITQVATVHDQKTYGRGLVNAFTEAVNEQGGKVVDAETISPGDKDFGAVISKIKSTNPQAIYYGGEYPQAAPFDEQLKNAGLKIPMVGGDGMYDPTYIELVGRSAAEGDLATSVGAPIDRLPSAQKFVEAYAKAGYKEPYAAYGAYAYDAAQAIVEGLKTSLKSAQDGRSARKGTLAAMGSVDFTGATGEVAFDQYGDAKSRVLTVYKVKSGMWAADQTEDFK